MIGRSLIWIDWKRMPGALLRESAGRFFLFLLLGALFEAMLLSGGTNRYLSDRWRITAVLRLSVTAVEGEGMARKAAGLPEVHSAEYRDPETSWKEFIDSYPGMEALRAAGGNPLPGYVEIRMRPDRFTEGDFRSVEAVLKPLPEVEKLLSGGEAHPRLLRVSRWMNVLLWAGFYILCAVSFSVFYLQEKARATFLSGEFDYLRERGVSAQIIPLSRAVGTALAGGVLSLAAMAATVSIFIALSGRLPAFSRVIGPAAEILAFPFLIPWAVFIPASTILSGGASLLGWRAAQSRPSVPSRK